MKVTITLFTGKSIGEYEAIKNAITGNYEVSFKDGQLAVFDAESMKQTNNRKPQFACKMIIHPEVEQGIHLTELEKATLRQCFSYGFAFDDTDSNFLCWGVEGKKERGALTSLNKKGVVSVFVEDGDTYVYCGEGYTKEQLIDMCEYKD